MSLRARPRVVLLAVAALLVALGLWAVLDGPEVGSPGYAQVQCRSVTAGADPVVPVPEDQDVDLLDENGVRGFDEDDLLHEDAGVLDPGSLPDDSSEVPGIVDSWRDNAETCDAARTHRLYLAGLTGFPATLLLAIAALARHDDRPRPPRRRFVLVDGFSA